MWLYLDEERDVWITPKGISQSPLHGPCDLLYMQVPRHPCPVRLAGLGLLPWKQLFFPHVEQPRQKPPWGWCQR